MRFGSAATDRRSFELQLAALHAGVFDDEEGGVSSGFWIATADLPTARGDWAAELLAGYLARVRQETTSDEDLVERLSTDEHWAPRYFQNLARTHPRAFADVVLPFFVSTLRPPEERPVEGVFFDDWSARSYGSPSRRGAESLFTSLDASLRALAKSQPRTFRRLARKLEPLLISESARFLLYRGFTANPRTLHRDAVDTLLTTDPPPFRAGYINAPYWATTELVKAIQPYIESGALHELEARFRSFTSPWERSKQGRRDRGASQLILLEALDRERLTPAGRRQADELRRKFGDASTEPDRIISGYVGSPIPATSAARMSDDAWLSAIARYRTDESSGFRGGAIELSRVLEAETKRDPERFAALSRQFDASTNTSYFDAVLRGLGDAEREFAPEALFAVLRHFFSLPARPGGRWIARPLGRVADSAVPDDIIAIAVWFATEDPDPRVETWLGEDGGVTYYAGDPFTAGINSVRGVAAEALSLLIWPKASRIEQLRPALQALANDASIAVRTCVAVTLRSIYRHEPDFAISLFEDLVQSPDILLASTPVEQFIATSSRHNAEIFGPIIERMLLSEDDSVREAGGRQAALFALGDNGVPKLVEEGLLSARPEVRNGIAQVAARNVSNVEVREACARWLSYLAFDVDPEVRRQVATWCSELGPGDLRELEGLALAYVESPAHSENEHWLLNALDGSTRPSWEVTIRAVERFLDQHELGMIQQTAPLDAPAAARLAMRAYTSVTGAEERARALDLVEKLLAARVSEVAEFVG